MNDLDLSQKVSISQPKATKGYGIQVIEWEYIKNKVEQIKDEPNLYLILSSVFLGACVSTFIYSLTGYFPKNPNGSISTSYAISWLSFAFTGILSLICFLFSRKFSEIKWVKASYIVEQMEIIEARYKSEEIEPSETPIETAFTEVFDSFDGWEQYLEGRVSHSNEVRPHTGLFCLKKEYRNDPHGGYKIIGKSIGLGFIFSGWIFRLSGKSGGKGDRLAIENEGFNGYGFYVNLAGKFAVIERRDGGIASKISRRSNFDPPQDEWYQFEFYSSSDGKFALYLNNSQGDRLLSITAVDSKYNQFDRIVIHGGQHYFVDNIKVIKA